MIRGYVLGALGIAIGIVVEAQFFSMLRDIGRYDKLRAMSGDPSLLQGITSMVFGTLTQDTTAPHGNSVRDALQETFVGDLIKYARIRAM